jgi:two-component system, chemotaxis family, protein-glutamate methylesterase/glutaminase
VSRITKSVLIVDDNAFICEALSELFQREADFEICGRAENGKEAIEKAQELHPDFIVLDFSMPVMTGFDAACSETVNAYHPTPHVQRIW